MNVAQADHKKAGSSAAAKSRQNLNQVTLDQLSIPESVANAEILWCLKVVIWHFSFRPSMELSTLFMTAKLLKSSH